MNIPEITFFTRAEHVIALNGVIVIKFSRDFRRRRADSIMRKTGLKFYWLNSLSKSNIKHVLMTPSTYEKLLQTYGELAEKHIGGVDLKKLNKFYSLINPHNVKSSLQYKNEYITHRKRVNIYSKEYLIVIDEVFKRGKIPALINSTKNSIEFPYIEYGEDMGFTFFRALREHGWVVDFYEYHPTNIDGIQIRLYKNLSKFNGNGVFFIDKVETFESMVDEFGIWFKPLYLFMNSYIKINKDELIKRFKKTFT